MSEYVFGSAGKYMSAPTYKEYLQIFAKYVAAISGRTEKEGSDFYTTYTI